MYTLVRKCLSFSVAIDCSTGMVYQQCGSLCIQTCTSNITSECHDGCAEGCFCPDGQVLSNGRCINPIACPGLYIVITIHVYTRVCICMYVYVYIHTYAYSTHIATYV